MHFSDAPYVLVIGNDGAAYTTRAAIVAPAEQLNPDHPLDVMAAAFLDARDRHGDERAAMAEALGVLAVTEIRTPVVRGPHRQVRRISAKRERAFRATLDALIAAHLAPRTEALSL